MDKLRVINKLMIVLFGLVGIWTNGVVAEVGCSISLLIWVYTEQVVELESKILKLLKGE